MNQHPRDAGLAKPDEVGDQVLADAREALADAREALLAEREAQADLRDAAAGRRDHAADETTVALQAREEKAAERTEPERSQPCDGPAPWADQQLRAELDRRAERLHELIDAADARDHAAELRDRAAETREAAAAVRAQNYRDAPRLNEQDRAHANIDRIWAGTDRDAAAGDRDALRDMTLKEPAEDE